MDVLLNFVIDRSGSMQAHVGSTIKGINDFLAEQRATEGKTLVSMTFFDTGFEVRYVAQDIKDIPPLGSSANFYGPAGGTALFDAVGTAVKGAEAWQDKHPGEAESVITIIMTDGGENSSRQWHILENADPEDELDVNNLLNFMRGKGWEFVFLGAGQAAWTESRRWAIPTASVVNYATMDNHVAYAGTSSSLASYRSGASKTMAGAMTTNSVLRGINVDVNENQQTDANEQVGSSGSGS